MISKRGGQYLLNTFNRIKKKLKYRLLGREAIDKRNRRKLKNKDFTLISNNCNGGVILHDLGLPFNSPFVNLWIKPHDYIKMLSSLEEYLSYELFCVEEKGVPYPVGQLKDIRIYFQHYPSFEDAKEKWERRKNRMNWEKIYVLFADRDNCTLDDLKQFDQLPYKKIVFTHVPHDEIKSAYYFRGFEDQDSLGVLSRYYDTFLKRRYLDDFDYVNWLNDD